tara:strand:- start:66 stop:455 length:390 start_codon:yes stop_codon:yes gene_type:complete
MLYFSLFVICVLATSLLIHVFTEDEHITISKHSDILNDRTLKALFQAMQTIEVSRGHSLQFLINAGAVCKEQVEQHADSIMFNQGEFPAEELVVDPQDFARLINVYNQFIGPDATDHKITVVIKTLFKY